jgi:Bacterial protein of unknown function (DUF937)
MNVIEMLKSQIDGPVGKQIAETSGASETDVKKVAAVGLPGLLAGLGSMASKKEGAGKLADTIGGMDLGSLGNLAGMLKPGASQQGGGMLGGLLGNNVVDGLANTISKATGVNVTIVKTILGYLAPMILSAIAGGSGGGKPNAAGITKFMDDQRTNISAALPAGFSLPNIPGIGDLGSVASNVGNVAANLPKVPSGGLGLLMLPLLLIAAIGIGIAWYIYNSRPAVNDSNMPTSNSNAQLDASAAIEQSKQVTADVQSKLDELTAKTKEAMSSPLAANLLSSGMDTVLGKLSDKLGTISDAPSAEAALPDLKDVAGKLDGFAKTYAMLPDSGKAGIVNLVKAQLEKINPLLDKITAIPGVGDTVKEVIEQIKSKLVALIGA